MIKYFISWFLFVLGIVMAVVAGIMTLWFSIEVDFFSMIISAIFIPFGVALGCTSWKYLEVNYKL